MSLPNVGEIWRHKSFDDLYIFITGVGEDNIYFYQLQEIPKPQMRSKVLFYGMWRLVQ